MGGSGAIPLKIAGSVSGVPASTPGANLRAGHVEEVHLPLGCTFPAWEMGTTVTSQFPKRTYI